MIATRNRRKTARGPGRRRLLHMEALESRWLLSGTVLQTNLVSDLPGVAAVQDSNLVNPWGIADNAASPFWISDNNGGASTLYNVPGANNTAVSINPLVVSMPAPGDPLGASGTPTGTVFNIGGASSGGFKVNGVNAAGGSASAPAIFLFATEDGTIIGWNPTINPQGFDPATAGTHGIIAVNNSGNNFTQANPDLQTGAVYKGLSIASGSNGAPIASTDPKSTFLLYATNFRAGKVEVYDPDFTAATLPAGAFSDANIPTGYAPFNVQVLGNKVYVTYAEQDALKHDDVAGRGHGFVDVFNLDGTPGLAHNNVRLVSRGVLDSPWGLAVAPSSFGSLAGDLLVGNFGNGRINAFNPTTGAFAAQLTDHDGEPIQIDGLWALKTGNGGNGGDPSSLYFTAGLFGESHGLFGSLTPVAAGTPEGPAEAQMVRADLDVAQLNLSALQSDIANHASRTVIRQDAQGLVMSVVDLVRAEHNFVRDSFRDGSGFPDDSAIDAFFRQLRGLHLDW